MESLKLIWCVLENVEILPMEDQQIEAIYILDVPLSSKHRVCME